jgi:hypothetical protein
MPGLGGYKYTACRAGPKLGRILGGASTPALVHAAYAASTWNKVDMLSILSKISVQIVALQQYGL